MDLYIIDCNCNYQHLCLQQKVPLYVAETDFGGQLLLLLMLQVFHIIISEPLDIQVCKVVMRIVHKVIKCYSCTFYNTITFIAWF